jgi:glycosyltransferase involved in cell wall biosynthesis
MSLRIGIDYTAAVRQGAGIGRYTRGLVQALARLDQENRYTLFTPHDSEIHQRYRLSGNEKILLIGEPAGDNIALFEELLTRKGVMVIVAPLNRALAVLRQQMPHQAWLFSWTADLERMASLAALVTEARSLAIPLHRIPKAGRSLGDLLGGLGSRPERPPSDVDAALPPQVKVPNFQDRRAPLSERALTILWHRLGLPIPVEWFTGPVDIFHSTDFVLPPVRQAKTILTVHDLTFMRLPQCAEAGLRAYLNKVVPRSIERADLVLADSQSTKNDLVELLGVFPGKIEVVYAGVERRFRPMEGEMALQRVRKRYGLDFPFILSLGTLEPRKNFTGLIEAYALLRGKGQGIGRRGLKLVIAGGKGWLYDEIFGKVEELSLENKIVFPGFIADEDLPALYNLAELFVFPSLYEGFGLPPLEAMACGTPVVTSDRPSLPEVVGEAGLMVEATDSQELAEVMERVLTDENLRQEMREKGLKQAERFTWEAAAGKLLDMYRRLGSQ